MKNITAKLFQKPSRHDNHIKIAIFIIILLGISIYSNSLHGRFISDDYIMIVQNHSITQPYNFIRIWDAFNTRFIAGLSFALNYWLGGYSVFGYHLFNVAIHIINCICVYFLVLLIFTVIGKQGKAKRYSEADKYPIALFTSLIFLCHPIQTQAVAYITQRVMSLATMFYLISLICYIYGRSVNKKRFIIISFCSMIIGMFTKEMVVVLPIMLIVCEIFFFGPLKKDTKARFKTLMPFILALSIIPLTLLLNRSSSVLNLKAQIARSCFDIRYLFTEINVIRTYLRLLVLPIKQIHDYDYPVTQSFFELPTILSVLLVIGLWITAIRLFKRHRLLSFCMVWFFLTIIVEVLHPCFIKKGLLYEHWLYLAMVGFSLFCSIVLYTLIKPVKRYWICMGFIIFIYCALTYQRNYVWKDDLSLWLDNVKKTPQNATAYINAGFAYGSRGEFDKEIEYYKKALAFEPKNSRALNNIGVAYKNKGDLDTAITYYKKATQAKEYYHSNESKALAFSNLGEAYAKKGDKEKAIKYHQKAIELQPWESDFYTAFAESYEDMGKYDLAVKYFEKALGLDPNHIYAKKGLKRVMEVMRPGGQE